MRSLYAFRAETEFSENERPRGMFLERWACIFTGSVGGSGEGERERKEMTLDIFDSGGLPAAGTGKKAPLQIRHPHCKLMNVLFQVVVPTRPRVL
jgi:hypothetical protein